MPGCTSQLSSPVRRLPGRSSSDGRTITAPAAPWARRAGTSVRMTLSVGGRWTLAARRPPLSRRPRCPLAPSPGPPGRPARVDLSVPDVQGAVAFYAAVIGWTFVDSGPDYGNYQIGQMDGRAAAGIGPVMQEGQPSAWTVYLASDDVDATATLIGEHGGSIYAGPMDIPGSGRMLIAADPTGGVFGVWQQTGMIGTAVLDEPGAFTWDDARPARRRGRETLLRRRVRLPVLAARAGSGRDGGLRGLQHRRRAPGRRHRRNDGRAPRNALALARLLHRGGRRRVVRRGRRRRRQCAHATGRHALRPDRGGCTDPFGARSVPRHAARRLGELSATFYGSRDPGRAPVPGTRRLLLPQQRYQRALDEGRGSRSARRPGGHVQQWFRSRRNTAGARTSAPGCSFSEECGLSVATRGHRGSNSRPRAVTGMVTISHTMECRAKYRITLPARSARSARSRRTANRTGTRSASAGTWVITPTIRSPRGPGSPGCSATISRLASSRVPKPSSRKIDSSRAAPPAASADSCADSASASARLAWNVSPPDSVLHRPAGVGVGVVDDEELAVVVGQLELPAGQLEQARRGVGDQRVERGGDQPAREPVGAQQLAEHPGHLLGASRRRARSAVSAAASARRSTSRCAARPAPRPAPRRRPPRRPRPVAAVPRHRRTASVVGQRASSRASTAAGARVGLGAPRRPRAAAPSRSATAGRRPRR